MNQPGVVPVDDTLPHVDAQLFDHPVGARYGERRESAAALSQRVNQRAI